MKVANLMSLRTFSLRSNDLTPRAMEYLKDAFTGGCFPALEVLDLRNNEFGDEGLDIFIRMFMLKHLEFLKEINLGGNNIKDAGFSKIARMFASLQSENAPYLVSLGLQNNAISGEMKRHYSPLPPFITL
jgi:Ran GTPase-activating protein (RanGAP) involved in mRNA processing and transport